ncbi:MAG: GBS Bsp-like repeat-containing protein, partial [Bacteroidales bacterium]|nr:GBS Bsp-like repeat-containing protein [Bacteroidales bacterium]
YWFYSEYLRYHFVMKEIVTEEDDVIAGAMEDFSQASDELAAYLYNTPSDEVTLDALSQMIDVDSFIKYFLVNEYVLNKESFVTSFYWYKDGPEDVIHLGPIWDFDTCMGNDGSSYTDHYGQKYFLFNYLFAAPAFYERFEELQATYKNTLLSMNQDVAVLKAQIADSAEMNYLRWDVLGKPNPKGGSAFKASFDEAVTAVETWLNGRAKSFAVPHPKVVTSIVSDDCYEMDIFLEGEESYEQVKFGVWSYANGQDDIHWYQAYERDDGVWTFKVDLTKHASAGLYRIEAYANNKKPWVASGCNVVKEVKESPYKLTGTVTSDCKTMSLRLSDTNRCSDITFALWSRENGQDDLHWYPAKRNADGVWAAEADLGEHTSKGTYTLHAYTGTGKARRLVEEMAVDVAFAVYNPKFAADVARDCTKMDITLSQVVGFEKVWVELLKNTDPATAATRYDLVQGHESVWLTSLDLTKHDGAGEYSLSFYGTKNGLEEKIIDVEVVAELLVFPVYRLYNKITQEHLLTANEEEMNSLVAVGWTLDGQAWKTTKIGTPVYRLYNPFDDWHTYSTSQDEIAALTALGWTVDGIVFHSVEEEASVPVYRLFNPYEQKNYHLLTASESEKDQLLALGWTLDGIALNALQE